jgi:hypothetical protein
LQINSKRAMSAEPGQAVPPAVGDGNLQVEGKQNFGSPVLVVENLNVRASERKPLPLKKIASDQLFGGAAPSQPIPATPWRLDLCKQGGFSWGEPDFVWTVRLRQPAVGEDESPLQWAFIS